MKRYRLIRRQKVQTLTSLNLSVIMMSVNLIEQMKMRLNQSLILLEWNPQSSFHINPWSMSPSLNADSAGCRRKRKESTKIIMSPASLIHRTGIQAGFGSAQGFLMDMKLLSLYDLYV